MANATVKVTLIKSVNGRLANHKACVKGLGLRRINQQMFGKAEGLGWQPFNP